MLGLLLLYWIGKYFYKLAEDYDKSQWTYAILGILVYYAGTFVFGLAIGTIIEIASPGYVETINEFLFGLLMIPFGLLCCYLFYDYLKRSWKRNEALLEEQKILEESSEPVEPA